MSEVNWVLDRSYPEVSGNDWGAIPKEENTPKHEYDQAKCLSITTKSYIANNTNTEVRYWGSDVKSLKQRSEVIEVRGLIPAGANSGGWYRKINSGAIPDSIC